MLRKKLCGLLNRLNYVLLDQNGFFEESDQEVRYEC
jgi:hypothetical protein